MENEMSASKNEVKIKLEEDKKVLIPFFHGRISSDVAEERLKSHNIDGGYIFRESSLRAGVFIISSMSKGSVSHTMIPQNGKPWQTYHEAVGKMNDLVSLSKVYLNPVVNDPLTDEMSFKEEFDKSESIFRLKFGCSCCNFTAVSKGDLDNHLRNHHKVKKCYICMTYVRANIFNYHDKVCNKKTQKDLQHEVVCDVCKFKTIHQSSLRRHRKIHDSKPYRCQTCKSLFKTENEFQVHECFLDIKFKCKYCEKPFGTSSNFHRHMKNHFKDHKENMSTVQRPKGRTYYKCDQCLFKTKCRKSLAKHKNHKHIERNKKNMICEFCTYESPWLSRMKKHRLSCKQGFIKPVIVSIIGEETICMK